MNVARLKIPTIVIAVVALVVGVSSGAVAAKLITGKDIKDNTVTSADIKNGTLVTKDLKQNAINGNRLKKGTVNGAKLQGGTVAGAKLQPGSVGTGKIADGAVTADKLAPGAVAFPQTLWGPMLRNQVGAGQSTLVTGPTGQPMGDGSLQLSTQTNTDIAAFGDSVDAAGIQLADITNLSYWSFNPSATPAVMPRLDLEINPHLVADNAPRGVFEFTTLVYQPVDGTGWVEHTGILADTDTNWYLTGQEGIDMGCTQDTKCTFNFIRDTLVNSTDGDTEPPAISSGIYFALGSGIATPTTTNVDKFVFNNNFTFDFEPDGVFLTTS